MEIINTVHKSLKQNAHIMNLLRFYRGIDRSEISRRLKISMPTVYKAVDELSNLNIIKKVDNDIIINDDYAYMIGISIGSAQCKISFLDMNFNLPAIDKFRNYKEKICKILEDYITDKQLLNECMNGKYKNYIYFKTPSQFSELKNALNGIFDFLQQSIENGEFKILCIGISCTGIINNKLKVIVNAHNLDYLDGTELDTLLFPDKQEFFKNNNIYIDLVQNGDASVIAEKIQLYQSDSPYKTRKNIIALYLGIGIGAGIYLERLYSGTSGFAGEIGHISAPMYEKEYAFYNKGNEEENKNDMSCTCGNNDCYDYKIRAYVFGETKESFSNFSTDKIKSYLAEEKHKDRVELFGKYLGNIINSLTSILNVDLIIFTGKFHKCMDLLYNTIATVQDQNKMKFSRNDCKLITSSYGSLAPSMGAAIYAYHRMLDLELSWEYE